MPVPTGACPGTHRLGADRWACDDGPVHASATLALSAPVDVYRTLRPLRRGPRDPAFWAPADGVVWRATLLATGPAAVRYVTRGPRAVDVDAWGPGADEAVAAAPALLGEHDDVAGFDPGRGPVRDAHRRFHTARIGRTDRVFEALVPAILEQRVIVHTAHDAWRWLLRAHGERAPGPAPEWMRVPPSAKAWAAVPVWDFHRAGVDPARARTIRVAAQVAGRLDEAAGHGRAETWRRLLTVPGVGPWTAAECAQRAIGDADAVPVGDYHLPNLIGWALSGRRGDDAAMLELLEPWRGHRYRVIRYLLMSGATRQAPRYGPRLTVEDHRAR